MIRRRSLLAMAIASVAPRLPSAPLVFGRVSASDLRMRAIACSLGLPYEALASDFSKSTYSSARAVIEAERLWRFEQSAMVAASCNALFQAFVAGANEARPVFKMAQAIGKTEALLLSWKRA